MAPALVSTAGASPALHTRNLTTGRNPCIAAKCRAVAPKPDNSTVSSEGTADEHQVCVVLYQETRLVSTHARPKLSENETLKGCETDTEPWRDPEREVRERIDLLHLVQWGPHQQQSASAPPTIHAMSTSSVCLIAPLDGRCSWLDAALSSRHQSWHPEARHNSQRGSEQCPHCLHSKEVNSTSIHISHTK